MTQVYDFLKYHKGAFTYQDIINMSIPEFYEWRNEAIKVADQELKRSKNGK